MKTILSIIVLAGCISPSFAGQYALTNDITFDIVDVFICATGWMDSLPVPVSSTQEVESIYFYIDSLGPEDAIFIGFDFTSGTAAQNMLMAVAGLRHAFAKNTPVFMTADTPLGQDMIEQGFAYVTDPAQDYYYQTVSWPEWMEFREQGIVTRTELVEAWEAMDNVLPENALGWVFEGRDYVLLGYRPMYNLVILGMDDSIENQYHEDLFGNPLGEMPMLHEHTNLHEIDLVLTCSGSSACLFWVTYGYEKIGLPVALGVTAVMTPNYFPYIQSGQIIGLMDGMQGAAEYELLLAESGAYPSPDRAIHNMMLNYAATGSLDWGNDQLGDGEVIPRDSTRVFQVENGHYDIKLIDDHSRSWLYCDVPIFEFAESGIYREYDLFAQ